MNIWGFPKGTDMVAYRRRCGKVEAYAYKRMGWKDRLEREQTKAEIEFGRMMHPFRKFYRTQEIFTFYGKTWIADFYFPDLRLCVEIDGYHHLREPQLSYDAIRQSAFNKHGIYILRFLNGDVLANPQSVRRRFFDYCSGRKLRGLKLPLIFEIYLKSQHRISTDFGNKSK